MRDQESVNFNTFNGLWSRGDDDLCPIDHFIDCENLKFNKIGVETREGTTISTTRGNRIARMALYKPLTGSARILLLEISGGGPNYDLYDLGFSLVTPIKTIAHSDFSMANMYGRAFISFHDQTLASCTDSLYIYDGTGPTGFRLAGGAPPTSTLVETATGAGNIELGILLLMYAFETNTGFITKPYVGGLISHTFAANGNSITVTVPVGPAGTVARRLVAAKTIPTGLYNNDYRSQIFYFVPGNGRIADNVTTSVTLSFFNSELVDSADFLFDQLTTIPSGLFVNSYGTRLAVGGDSANASIARFSEISQPESFSATSGFTTVDPAESGGVKNGFEYQGSFVLLKSRRTYITGDNGGPPSSWLLDSLDTSVGSECHGVSVISDSQGSWKNVALVADRAGLMLFSGVYSDTPLTDKIKEWWAVLDNAVFSQIQVIVDHQIKRVYCLVPKGSDNTLPYCNTILVGDYTKGLTPQDIKWCPWAFHPESADSKASINCIVIDLDTATQRGVFKLGMNTDLVVLDATVKNDLGSRYSIPSWARFPFFTFDAEDTEMINTFISIRARLRGLGRVYLTYNHMDDTIVRTFKDFLDISPTPGHPYDKLLNFVGEKISITLHMNTQLTQPFNDNYWQLTKMTLYGKTTWAAMPSLTHMQT